MTEASLPGEASLIRPTETDIRRAWDDLFGNPLVSTASLKRTAVDGLPSAAELHLGAVDNWTPLRSLHWKLSLSILPSPTPELFQTPLSTTRQAYDDLRYAYLRSPDGRYPTDISVPPSREPATPGAAPGAAAEGRYDPLSLEEESPWNKYYRDLEVKKEIRKDVERTFPDIAYFKTDYARVMLTTILFLHCTLHPDVSYRQGMHELAAAVLLAVELDSLSPLDAMQSSSSSDAILRNTFSRVHVEHDAYTLFSTLMRNGGQALYAHHPEPDTPKLPRGAAAHNMPAIEAKQPIIKVCDAMWELLGRVDPTLKAKLDREGIEPQLFGIRWVRLLFTREFPLPTAMQIWDAIFALDHSLSITIHICITLLLRIRNILLAGDYSDCLTSLLRYPPHSVEYPLDPLLLVQQALEIKGAPVPTTGVHVIIQNAELLGIPSQAPQADGDAENAGAQRGPGERDRPRQQPQQQPIVHQRNMGLPASFSINIGAAVAAAQSSGLGELAKGLAIKGREIGEKALREQVSQMKRNLPDFPASPSGSGLLSPRPPGSDGFPSASSPITSALEAEVASLRARMWSLGSALDKCLVSLDAIQLALPPLPPTPSGEPGLDEKMARALVGVQLVREALGEPDRVFDQGLLHEVLTGKSNAMERDGPADSNTQPTSPTFTPIVSPSPANQSPYIPPQPPSPSASPPPDLNQALPTSQRTVSGGEGVSLPTLAHPARRLPSAVPPAAASSGLTPPSSASNLRSPSSLALPPTSLSHGPSPARKPPPTAPAPSLARRLAMAARGPDHDAPFPSPRTAAPSPPPTTTSRSTLPWVRATPSTQPLTHAGQRPLAVGVPLAGPTSTARTDHWRSVSSSQRNGESDGGSAGSLAGGDPLGAL